MEIYSSTARGVNKLYFVKKKDGKVFFRLSEDSSVLVSISTKDLEKSDLLFFDKQKAENDNKEVQKV